MPPKPPDSELSKDSKEPTEGPALRQRVGGALEAAALQRRPEKRRLHHGQHVGVPQQAILACEAGMQAQKIVTLIASLPRQ